MRNFSNKFFTALEQLTVLRRSKKEQATDGEMERSLIVFPLVGFFIGAILVLANNIFDFFLPTLITDIITVFLLLLLTKSQHLKGLLFMITGNSEFSKTESSNSMSKRGFLIIFILMIKILLINYIVPGWKNAALLFMPVMGRWPSIFFPYLSHGKPDTNIATNTPYGKISIKDFWFGTVITSLLALLLLGINGIVIFMMVSFVAVFIERIYQKKTDGVYENISSGMVEITEIITLLLFNILEFSSRSFISDGVFI